MDEKRKFSHIAAYIYKLKIHGVHWRLYSILLNSISEVAEDLLGATVHSQRKCLNMPSEWLASPTGYLER